MSEEVKREKTPASEGQVVDAIKAAWPKVFGETPTIEQIGKAWSQIALETGNGKAISNFNVGNYDWSKNFSGNYYVGNDSITVGNDPNNRKHYKPRRRAYSSLVDGVSDYLSWFKNKPSVLRALKEGSPKDLSFALAAAGYYDRHVRDDYIGNDGKKIYGYTTGLTQRYNQFLKNKTKEDVPKAEVAKQEATSEVSSLSMSSISDFIKNLLKKVEEYMSVFANEKSPYLISLSSDEDFSSKLEFARILSTTLKEELNSTSDIFTNNKEVEIKCFANNKCEVNKLCNAVSDAFQFATKSIGGIKISTSISNMSTSYQKLGIKLAYENYLTFQNKFRK